MEEQAENKPRGARLLIDQITGVDPAIAVVMEAEELAPILHGLIQNGGIDRRDTLGNSATLQTERNYQGEVAYGDLDDVLVQEARDVVNGNGSTLDALIALSWTNKEDERFPIRNRATFILYESFNRF